MPNNLKLYKELLSREDSNKKALKKQKLKEKKLLKQQPAATITASTITHALSDRASYKPQPTKTIFEYKCRCGTPIIFEPHHYDDFNNRYIPISAYTLRTHSCKNRKNEKQIGLLNGITPPSSSTGKI